MTTSARLPWRLDTVSYAATGHEIAEVIDRLEEAAVERGEYSSARGQSFGWLCPESLPAGLRAVVAGYGERRIGERVHVRAGCFIVEVGVPVAR